MALGPDGTVRWLLLLYRLGLLVDGVIVTVARSTRRDPQALVHGDERHKPDEDCNAQQQVLIRLD